ncbi:MAG: CAP domain-containing protein [Polyangiaceae bacterium]
MHLATRLCAFAALASACGVACSSSDQSIGVPASAGSGTSSAGSGMSSAGSGTSSAGSGSGDTEPAAQQGMTAAHNAARAAVMPAATPAIPPLGWSAELAATAQAWAAGCKFQHSGGKYGEDLYASAGQAVTPQAVVDSWVGEAKDYDYAANSCSGVCGHYTQVVWRDSAKLGCGVTNCSTNSPFNGFPDWQIWVCNYDPPGNFNGKKPY